MFVCTLASNLPNRYNEKDEAFSGNLLPQFFYTRQDQAYSPRHQTWLTDSAETWNRSEVQTVLFGLFHLNKID